VPDPTDGEPRIPAWAPDDFFCGKVTQSILREAGTADPWYVYHFLTTPQGFLHGLRPLELLVTEQRLTPSQRLKRSDLMAYLDLSSERDFIRVVRESLKADLNEND
jgi:hypothetical protein